jgi:hypothetical protein
MVDNLLVDIKQPYLRKLKGSPLTLLCIIYSKSNNTNYIPSFKQITKNTGMARETLKKSLTILEELNLIKVVRKIGFKPRIIILPIPEIKSEKPITENKVVKYIEDNYNTLTPKSKKVIYEYIVNDKSLDAKMPDSIKMKIQKDKQKLRLIS